MALTTTTLVGVSWVQAGGAYYDPFAIGAPSTWCSMAYVQEGVIDRHNMEHACRMEW